ncbi:uncharacterized protein AB675_7713 [Cyphellophora attinorum]|uniref:GATA-type domain-containing protein n=1 Tax=Cyphellophora attinorum TaxID=1664694 RepID=A0A0N0NMP4_9EURO|nr:uncharacterized protein AB675_7713 [Phialophora attinorum]KPI40588.1 hypothetical protein AB675_7713 [Phialophora attinorum]
MADGIDPSPMRTRRARRNAGEADDELYYHCANCGGTMKHAWRTNSAYDPTLCNGCAEKALRESPDFVVEQYGAGRAKRRKVSKAVTDDDDGEEGSEAELGPNAREATTSTEEDAPALRLGNRQWTPATESSRGRTTEPKDDDDESEPTLTPGTALQRFIQPIRQPSNNLTSPGTFSDSAAFQLHAENRVARVSSDPFLRQEASAANFTSPDRTFNDTAALQLQHENQNAREDSVSAMTDRSQSQSGTPASIRLPSSTLPHRTNSASFTPVNLPTNRHPFANPPVLAHGNSAAEASPDISTQIAELFNQHTAHLNARNVTLQRQIRELQTQNARLEAENETAKEREEEFDALVEELKVLRERIQGFEAWRDRGGSI